jgi:hypothetical protein
LNAFNTSGMASVLFIGFPRFNEKPLKSFQMFSYRQTWETRAGFEVLTAVVMKIPIFRDIIACSQLKLNWHFGGTFRLNFQAEE